MRKTIMLAVFLLIATSSFCQWTQGYLRDEFGDKTKEKYIAFTTKNGSVSKEGKTVVSNSTLVVNIKVFRNQDNLHYPYGVSFELFEYGVGKAINSTSVYERIAELHVKLSEGQIVAYPIFATTKDLRTMLFSGDKELIDLILKEIRPIRCIIKIDSKHTIARYSFTIDPNGFTSAFNKHIALDTPPLPLNDTIKLEAPSTIDSLGRLHTSMEISGFEMQNDPVIIGRIEVVDTSNHKVAIEEKPVYGVEQMPQFPGGDEELLKFIKDNLRYPKVAAEVGIEGRVTIRFVVNRNGDVTDVTVIRGLDPSCDVEAVRIVKMMPRWIPGRQNGRNVPVYYTLPVVYKLQK